MMVDKKIMPRALPSRKRKQLLAIFASHVFLLAVAVTMVAPFLWMLSTALKPTGQVMRQNWVPTREFVQVKGTEHEVVQRARAKDGAGTYRVRGIRTAPGRPDTMDVSSDRLTPEMGSDTRFALQEEADGRKTVVAVELVEKLVPERYEVQYRERPGGPLLMCAIGETDLITKASPRWENFGKAWSVSGTFGRAFINSLVIAIVITLGQVFTSSLAAYAFARLEFPGRDKLFLAYLGTMMVPGAVTMIPLFVILKGLPDLLNMALSTQWFSSQMFMQWWAVSPVREFYAGRIIGLDSYFALIVPGLFSAYGTFMLRQFFMTLPRELEDAARIDGCGTWGVYWNVVMPLSKPALATLAILTFMGAWRSFMWPMVVVSSPEMETLPVMLQSFMGVTGTQWELLMAGTLIVMGPMILVFLFGQKYIIKGIRLGGVKG
jgi:multiple sugar transport system permease protein